MASSTKSSGNSARTEPKGRATRARGEETSRSLISPTMQWVIVAILIAAVLGGVMYAFRGVSTPLGGHSGAPAPAVIDTAPAAEL